MTSNSYHIPVLLHAAVKGLNIQPSGIYVDVTFGGGGHSREILSHLDNGTLCAFDQDSDAKNNLINDSRFRFYPTNFSNLQSALAMDGIENVNGILADLGVSSHQFDDAERGFSLRYEAPLDMRMDQQSPLSAFDVINSYETEKLKIIFREYGEAENAGKLAYFIGEARKQKAISTTGELLQIIDRVAPRKKEKQYQAKIFQAIRIEVNDEMSVLRDFLQQSLKVLSPGGRLVVISYHSLEDRLVKNFMRSGNLSGEIEKDFFGVPITPFTDLTKKPLVPDEAEIEQNPRSRSAKLRIAEKK
ncbi:MAG: 16S rRNA (cytosine(1402)-N(4))-methyltransferase RsmH [Flavobacteriales bacterium]|nr:16S rRNA (cytosine(1402)-N(4))-methyltransferase RsmH [Flavobacteriales bacterium]